jgi:hypothetical protein
MTLDYYAEHTATCLACPLAACIHDPDGDPEAACPLQAQPSGHNNTAPDGCVSLTQAGRLLRASARTVRRWLERDGVPVRQLGYTQKSVLAVPVEWVEARRAERGMG